MIRVSWNNYEKTEIFIDKPYTSSDIVIPIEDLPDVLKDIEELLQEKKGAE